MQANEHVPSSLGEVREKHLEVFGEETGSYHKEFLRKRIAWRLQAVAEGDLSERARRRAEELANDADLRTRAPRDPVASGSAEVKARTATDRVSPSRGPRDAAEVRNWPLDVTSIPVKVEFMVRQEPIFVKPRMDLFSVN